MYKLEIYHTLNIETEDYSFDLVPFSNLYLHEDYNMYESFDE